jgi:two-component sensor histidine kinase
MMISGSTISSLALLLHELATNSAKYEAHSAADGQIKFHGADQKENIAITWSEHGGPPVRAPIGNEGFGDLLVRATATQLRGEIARDWRIDDLVIRLSMPRDRLMG